MVWKVKFSAKAEKQFDKLESKYQVQVFDTLTQLQDDPKSLPEGSMLKLVNKPGFRIRTGDVRIKVKFSGVTIQVFYIGLRSDTTYK